MNKRINFEDNMYALLTRIRMIRDLFVLDVDPEIFLEKILNDIDFIDNTLKTLFERLTENQRLIERDELLNHLSELEWQFGELITSFVNSEKALSVKEVPAAKEKLLTLRAGSEERRGAAENSTAGGKQSEEPLVSTSELNELLKSL